MPYFLLLIVLFLLGCDQSSPATNDSPPKDGFTNCKYGSPKAIFAKDLPQIKQHKFELTKNAGIEEIFFSDGKHLEIIQTGCDHISQEFRFRRQGDFRDMEAAFWIASAINELHYLGRLSEKYISFNMWATAIEEKATDLQVGEFMVLEGNFKIKIDRVLSSDEAVLILTLRHNELIN